MTSLFKTLSDEAGLILFILILATLVSGVALIVTIRRSKKNANHWAGLLRGASGENLETLLYEHLREKMRLEDEILQLQGEMKVVQAKVQTAKRHFGLVRYDAFDDVGGQQSFALAMIDDDGNGVVITGIVGRMDERVYSKPIVNYRTDRALAREEQKALQEAQSGGTKAILSE